MLTTVRSLVCLAYLSVWIPAVTSKFGALTTGAPSWFVSQFEKTILNLFPGSLALFFFVILFLEIAAVIGFAVGAFRRGFFEKSMLLSQLIFVILGFGLRITQDFHGAFECFVYFGITILIYFQMKPEKKPVD